MCKSLGNNVYECNGNCASGSVWGTGIYTSDSNIYNAAKHMGFLPGVFTKIDGPGILGFIGTNQNGVSTSNYGSYGGTFYLVKGIYNSNAGTEVHLKSLQTKIASLTAVQQKLTALINNYQNTLIQLQNKTDAKERELIQIEQKIKGYFQGDSRTSAVNKDLQQKMKSIYVSEMQKYNQNIMNMLTQKDYIPCSVCSDKKREAMLTSCGHAHYCRDCLKLCLQSGKCKVCDAEVGGYLYFKV